jgi:hypothetical protein
MAVGWDNLERFNTVSGCGEDHRGIRRKGRPSMRRAALWNRGNSCLKAPGCLGGSCISWLPQNSIFKWVTSLKRVCRLILDCCIAALACVIGTMSTSSPNRGVFLSSPVPLPAFIGLGLVSLTNYSTVSVSIWGSENWITVKTLCTYSTLPSIEPRAGWGVPRNMDEEAILHLL